MHVGGTLLPSTSQKKKKKSIVKSDVNMLPRPHPLFCAATFCLGRTAVKASNLFARINAVNYKFISGIVARMLDDSGVQTQMFGGSGAE